MKSEHIVRYSVIPNRADGEGPHESLCASASAGGEIEQIMRHMCQTGSLSEVLRRRRGSG